MLNASSRIVPAEATHFVALLSGLRRAPPCSVIAISGPALLAGLQQGPGAIMASGALANRLSCFQGLARLRCHQPARPWCSSRRRVLAAAAAAVAGAAEPAALGRAPAGFELRVYQRETVDAVQEAWARGVTRQLVSLPTGGGQSDCPMSQHHPPPRPSPGCTRPQPAAPALRAARCPQALARL